MQPFRKVVTPHPDVLLPHTRVEKYAADLWKVRVGEAAREYKDADTFFELTYLTRNMAQILDDIQDKLVRGEGDAFKHIETPFGGGKTHTMIAAYHKAAEWGIKTVVIDGTKLSANDTLWGTMEEQLEGRKDMMTDLTSPGGIKIKKLLDRHRQVLILIDELGEYMVKALGRPVGSSTLAAQTSAFVQELTGEVANMDKVCVLASFLTSGNEFLEKKKNWAEVDKILYTLGKLTGRHDHKITPIGRDDLPHIIRRRLFVTPDVQIEQNAKDTVSEFVLFCKKNDMLPPNADDMGYGRRFIKSYPFLPDVIDVLYDAWGTFGSFQRTRGVLKLLAMVVNNLKDSDKPYITLADFDFSNDIIRHELVQHVGHDMDGVISDDITNTSSGGKNVPYGVPCATAMFMHSFDKHGGRGATITEIKRAVADPDIHPVDVSDAVKKLTRHLYYMKRINGKYKFGNRPNINRIKYDTEVLDDEIKKLEQKMLESHRGNKIQTYVWPDHTTDVDDDDHLKLVILNGDDQDKVRHFMNRRGEVNRSNKNAVLVLCPSDTWYGLRDTLRGIILTNKILAGHHNLSGDDHAMLRDDLRGYENDISGALLNGYKTLYVPGADGPERVELPLFTTDSKLISDTIYDLLLNTAIHDRLDPRLLLYTYDVDTIYTNNVFGSMLRNPGSRRPTGKKVIKDAIVAGVEKKLFGLGIKTESGVICRYYGDTPTVSFSDNEVLIKNPDIPESPKSPVFLTHQSNARTSASCDDHTRDDKTIGAASFSLRVGMESVSDLAKVIARMQERDFSVDVTVDCTDGSITEDDMEDIKDMIYDINPNFKMSTGDTA